MPFGKPRTWLLAKGNHSGALQKNRDTNFFFEKHTQVCPPKVLQHLDIPNWWLNFFMVWVKIQDTGHRVFGHLQIFLAWIHPLLGGNQGLNTFKKAASSAPFRTHKGSSWSMGENIGWTWPLLGPWSPWSRMLSASGVLLDAMVCQPSMSMRPQLVTGIPLDRTTDCWALNFYTLILGDLSSGAVTTWSTDINWCKLM